jgi:truncated hemoglobin YjbI
MEKVEKILEEQLQILQEFLGVINEAQNKLGGIEMQKHSLLHQIAAVQEDFSKFQKELEEEYGKVSISIEDGSLKAIEEETDEANSED